MRGLLARLVRRRRRLKVVYVLSSLGVAGGVKVIVEHAEGLAARGHDVSILTLGELPDWISIGVSVIRVPDFSPERFPRADVHIATWYETVVPTFEARRAAKVFHFSQGYEALYPHVAAFKDEIDRAYALEVPKLLISRHLVDVLSPRFPGPFFVLPQAIRGDSYAPKDPERAAPRARPTIGIVGPYEGLNKGIRVGLAAVRRLRDAGLDVRLQRVSQTPLGDEERAFGPCERYLHLASVAQMVGWYHELDVLIHPSFEAEGFPLPPLEAMAAGVPVVLTTIPSFDPIPRDAASWAAPGDDEAMAREARTLLLDPARWRKRRRRGLEVARTFSVDRAVRILEKALGA